MFMLYSVYTLFTCEILGWDVNPIEGPSPQQLHAWIISGSGSDNVIIFIN